MLARSLVKGYLAACLVFLTLNLQAQSGLIDIEFNTVNPSDCSQSNGEIHIQPLSGVAPFQFSIDGGATFQSDSSFVGLGIGTYILLARDAEQKISSYQLAKLTADGAPNINAVVMVNPIECGVGGSIKILAEEGDGNLQYSIDSGATFQSNFIFSDVSAGMYNVVVRNGNESCPSRYPTIVFEPQTPADFLTVQLSTTNPSCNSNNGQIDAQVFGGSGGYLYSLDGGMTYQEENIFQNLAAGNYSVLVKDTMTNCEKSPSDSISLMEENCMNCEDLTISFTKVDPECDSIVRKISFSVSGGSGNYAYSIDGGGTFQPSASFDSLVAGSYNLVVRDIDFDCEKRASQLATLTFVECLTCPQIAGLGISTVYIEECDEQGRICFSGADSLDLRIFTITDNGELYTGLANNCPELTLGFELFFDTGYHEIIFSNEELGCEFIFDLLVSCEKDTTQTDTVYIDRKLAVGEMDSICFQEYLNLDNVFSFEQTCEELNPAVRFDLNNSSHCLLFEGNQIGMESICLRVCESEDICTEVIVSVTVDSTVSEFVNIDTIIRLGEIGTICFQEYLMLDDVESMDPTCEGQSPSVGFDLNNLTKCLNYEGNELGKDTLCLQVCESSGRCIDVLFSVTVVDSINNCMPIFTTNTGMATVDNCNDNGIYCLNLLKSELANYTLLINGDEFTDLYADCDVPEQAALELPVGMHELILAEKDGECRDTASVEIVCSMMEREIFDTIFVNERDTFCMFEMDLLGQITSIENTCEASSGEMVGFTIDSSNNCLYYSGIEVGQDTACILACDDLGECATTRVIINVEELPDTIPPPIAIDDIDTLEENVTKVINVLANDTTNSTLVTVNIIDAPMQGIATVNLDLTISYKGNEDICDTTDFFTYELCNPAGCDTATVRLYITCKSLIIFNGFSPNQDGINETFTIKGIEDFPNNEVKIFNRWGNSVYTQKGYKGQWNGTWENKELPDGTYFYLLDDGEGKQYSGFLEIRR